MSDNKKYYYLKLKEDFFTSETITLLESMKDGIMYSNILLKLYLMSLKNNGKLIFRDNIPYTTEMIATITHHQVGTVERAIKIFLELELIDQLPDNILYMADIELFIGKSSTEGERKRKARLENQEKIYLIRGQKVMLDADLAEIYGYETKNFNRQVKNNIEKFEGEDFMF